MVNKLAKILQYIENIYSGIDLSRKKSKYIFNPSNFKLESGFKEYSRFPTSRDISILDPYVLSDSTLKLLEDKIHIVPNLWKLDYEDFDDHIIVNNDSELCLYEPNNIDDLTYLGEFTAYGLLAIRCGRFYGNELFRMKVETKLSEFRSEILFQGVNYFVTNSVNETITNLILGSKGKYDSEFITKFLNNTSFYWKDLIVE